MKQSFLVTALVVLFLGSSTGVLCAESPDQRVMIGVGGAGSGSYWKVQGQVYAFPSEWIGVMGGLMYSHSTNESTVYSISAQVTTVPDTSLVYYGTALNAHSISKRTSVDGLVGLHRPVLGRGFIFLGAGVTYQNQSVDYDSDSPVGTRFDYDPAWGSVLAATLAVPAGNRWFGFVSLTDRYLSFKYTQTVTAPADPWHPTNPRQSFTNTYKSGSDGLAATVGVGLGF